MPKPHRKINFRFMLSVITIFLVAFVIYQNWNDILEAINHIGDTNPIILALIIPEQLIMYFCCGQMFFSYLSAKRNTKPISPWELMRISLELNFVNHAVPAGGFGGLGYIAWRLKPYGSSPGQTSFMYALRYVITACANQLQTIIAIIVLACTGGIPNGSAWIVWTVGIICAAILITIVVIILVASSIRIIKWSSSIVTNFCNKLIRIVTFGHKKSIFRYNDVEKFFMDIHDNVLIARHNKRMLIKPILWGIIYSFLEVAIYWIVAISMGYPWIMPQIMIGEAVGSVTGAIMPYGLYELGMVGIMAQIGVNTGVASLVVIIARVIALGSTVISGYGFYQHAISKLGKKQQDVAN